MRRIESDEPLRESPKEESSSQEGAAKEKAAALFDAAVAKEKAATAAGPSKDDLPEHVMGQVLNMMSAAKAAWAVAESSSSAPTLDEAIALLLRNGSAQFHDVHETLNKILDNVTANPGDDKYRRLKRSNPVLNMKVFSAKGSERFLQCVGFVEQRDDKDGTFVLRAEGVKGTLSHFQKTRLAAGKDALKTAKACKATFHVLER